MYSPLSGKHEIYVRDANQVASKIPHTPGRLRAFGLGGFTLAPTADQSCISLNQTTINDCNQNMMLQLTNIQVKNPVPKSIGINMM